MRTKLIRSPILLHPNCRPLGTDTLLIRLIQDWFNLCSWSFCAGVPVPGFEAKTRTLLLNSQKYEAFFNSCILRIGSIFWGTCWGRPLLAYFGVYITERSSAGMEGFNFFGFAYQNEFSYWVLQTFVIVYPPQQRSTIILLSSMLIGVYCKCAHRP
jgi:hypothetical protein